MAIGFCSIKVVGEIRLYRNQISHTPTMMLDKTTLATPTMMLDGSLDHCLDVDVPDPV